MGEHSPGRVDRMREEPLSKGQVIYKGKKGHILSLDGKSGDFLSLELLLKTV